MASKRPSVSSGHFKNNSTSGKSSSGGTSKHNNSGTVKKNSVSSSGSIVKSRYLQTVERTSLLKGNSLTDDSKAVSPRSSPKPSRVKRKVVAPPRCSVTPQALPTYGEKSTSSFLETSVLGKSVLQSTLSDGHCIRPDFDISVIKDIESIQNAVELEGNPENYKNIIEMQAFLLTYFTVKMENSTKKLKAKAEARLLEVMEEKMKLHKEVQEKKRRYLFMERKQQMHELLDLQIAALTPLAQASKQFIENYKSFATAVDTTRHELPVKNFYIEGDRREFLVKVESHLKEIEKVLVDCIQGDHQDNSVSLECIRDMKTVSKDISRHLSGASSELLDLSSLVCQHTVHIQQALEEEHLGLTRTQELYCPKL